MFNITFRKLRKCDINPFLDACRLFKININIENLQLNAVFTYKTYKNAVSFFIIIVYLIVYLINITLKIYRLLQEK